MSLEIEVLEEVGIGPDKDDPSTKEFKFKITDPVVLHILRRVNNNRQDETIQKLANMKGTDVAIYICTCGMDPQDFLEMVMEDPKLLQGILIASRGNKQEEMCVECKKYDEGASRIFDGCYKVPGMEDLGCCSCACVGVKCPK